MKIGDIVLIPFPFSEITNIKIRPATLVCLTKDGYKDYAEIVGANLCCKSRTFWVDGCPPRE